VYVQAWLSKAAIVKAHHNQKDAIAVNQEPQEKGGEAIYPGGKW
jgi:hypothetical protein